MRPRGSPSKASTPCSTLFDDFERDESPSRTYRSALRRGGASSIPMHHSHECRKQYGIKRIASIAILGFVGTNCLIGYVLVSGPSTVLMDAVMLDYLHRQTTIRWTPIPFETTATHNNSTSNDIQDEKNGTSKAVKSRILNIQRQARTKPPSAIRINSNDASMDAILRTGALLGADKPIHVPVNHTQNWSLLCRNAGLNESSRVAIWNMLTQPPGIPLVLMLAKQCNIQVVLGIDSLFPNHQHTRLQQMQDYKDLKRNVKDINLLVAPSVLETDQYEPMVQPLVQFAPTHVVSLMTFPTYLRSVMSGNDGRYYEIKSGLLAMHTLITSMQRLAASAGRMHLPPTFLHVTSSDSKHSPWTVLPSILLKSFNDVKVTQLELPYLFGPMVSPLDDVRHVSPKRRMYVDDAVASMLLAMDPAYASKDAASLLIRFMTHSTVATSMTKQELQLLDDVYENETLAWMDNFATPHFESAANPATYLDTYGIHRTKFPCASHCESLACTPTLFDAIQNVSQVATEDCRAVLYMSNFSSALAELPSVTKSVLSDGYSSVGNICRVAFVSNKSKLVSSILIRLRRDQALLQREQRIENTKNGMQLEDWNVVWVDGDETTITDLEHELLRIDPIAMFAKSVDRALYSESIDMLQADNQHLERLFKKIWRTNVPPRTIAHFDQLQGIWRWIKASAQTKRRAILFARQPDEIVNVTALAEMSSSMSSRQLQFYEAGGRLILSPDGRTRMELQQGEFDAFPYQWISPEFILHELSMTYSQELRCEWMQEFLFWGGGGRNSSLLSLAYTLGKHMLQGHYAPQRKNDQDGSWLALIDKGTGVRMTSRRKEELFVRILPHDVAIE